MARGPAELEPAAGRSSEVLSLSGELGHDELVDAAHLADAHGFGPCLVPECPNYIGHHPAHRGATHAQLKNLHAAHQRQARPAALRAAPRSPVTLVRDADER